MRRNKLPDLTKVLPILLALTLVLAFPGLVSAQTATIVNVATPDQVESGEQFLVNIVVEPGTEIAGVQFDLAFDPSLVTVDSVEEGDLLSKGGAATYFSPGSIDNVAGSIDGVSGAIITPGQTVSATGTFAVITLTAGAGGGTCPLTLSGVIVGNINGQSVEVSVVNGQVIINAGVGTGGGSGGSGSSDKTPPRFSGIGAANLTMTAASIQWTTHEKSSSQVEYWASPSQFSSLDETKVINHMVHLAYLMPATTYHYRVMSRDIAGNLAVSDEYRFTTLGTPAEFTVNALSITPQEVHVGEQVLVSVSVFNSGDAAGSYEVIFKIDGLLVATQDISLDGGAIQEVTFLMTMTTAGMHRIDVNGLNVDIVVVEQPGTTISFFNIEPNFDADTGRLSFVSITYEVNNPAEQMVPGGVILNVILDSQPVDEVELISNGKLEPGKTSGSLDYLPAEGWKSGIYTFKAELHQDGKFKDITMEERLDVTAEYTTTAVNWSILGIIIGTMLIVSAIAVFFTIRFRRRII